MTQSALLTASQVRHPSFRSALVRFVASVTLMTVAMVIVSVMVG